MVITGTTLNDIQRRDTMGWLRRNKDAKERNTSPSGTPVGPAVAVSRIRFTGDLVPPPDPGRDDRDLKQRMFSMVQACGMTYAVRGPSSAEALFAGVAAAVPALSRSGEVGGGIGLVGGDQTQPWMVAEGSGSSLLFYFVTPDVDPKRGLEVMDALAKLPEGFEMVTLSPRLSPGWDRQIAFAFENTEAFPIWELPPLAHLRPSVGPA